MEDRMSRTYSHAKLSLAIWFSVLAFGAGQLSAATVTYVVGTCKGATQFSTIQSALDASPAPNTVEVCPGQYSEQVTITKPVTLEGITARNGDLAQIVLPGNYRVNAAYLGEEGHLFATVAQVYVNNVSGGAVNLENLDVNGEGFSANMDYLAGIFYQESSGTIDQVITSFQTGGGFGMVLQGGSSHSSVTVENSSIHDFDLASIYAVGPSEAPDLKVTIVNNNIATSQNNLFSNVLIEQGTDATVSGNVVSGGLIGITINASTGSFTDNTVLGSGIGISLGSDGPSLKSNKIFNTTKYGIDVGSNLEASVIEGNTVMSVDQPGSLDVTGTGIELNCAKVRSGHVSSNAIMDALDGYGDVPTGFTGSGTYAGVVTPVTTCANNAPASIASFAAGMKSLTQLRVQ
jgi:parallel beta-helix repeat protein